MELTFKYFFSEEEAFDQKKASHVIKLLIIISLLASFVFSFWTTGSVGECLGIGFGFWFGLMLVFLVIYLLRSCVPTHPLQFANSWIFRDTFLFWESDSSNRRINSSNGTTEKQFCFVSLMEFILSKINSSISMVSALFLRSNQMEQQMSMIACVLENMNLKMEQQKLEMIEKISELERKRSSSRSS